MREVSRSHGGYSPGSDGVSIEGGMVTFIGAVELTLTSSAVKSKPTSPVKLSPVLESLKSVSSCSLDAQIRK